MKHDFEFECNMSEKNKNNNCVDEWGSAFVWCEKQNIGVEYNLCVDGKNNSSAIYKMKLNEETEDIETDYDESIHYEIDFNDTEWKNKFEKAMCDALIKLHDLE